MNTALIQPLKWGLRLSFVLSMVLLFIVILNIIISFVTITLNGGVLLDLLYLIQVWLPFNLNPLLVWISTTVTAFIAYRLSIIAYNFLNNVIAE